MNYINLKKIAVSSAVGFGGALLIALPVSALSGTNTVDSGDIVDGSIVSADIANGSIRTGDLNDSSITTGKIKNNGVTSDDIANGAVLSEDIANGSIRGGDLASDIVIASDATRATGATGSFQNLAGDVTYEGAAGGTSYYHAGVMGNFHGDTLTNSTASLHAGVIGSYSVTTSDANPGAKAGVVGEVGDLAAGANAAVMAVLGGDGGVVTPNAAYGVQYFNSTAGSHFNYGLDLSHAATTGYTNSAVDYGTADIRLQNGETISNGTDGTVAVGATTFALGTTNLTGSGSVTTTGAVDFGGATSLKVPSSAQGLTDNTGSCTTGRITYDTTNNHFFGCVSSVWQVFD